MTDKICLDGGGAVQLQEQAGGITFSCRCPVLRDGIYKVWLRGDGGELLLGTLIPEGEHLALRRTIPREQLSRCGCWPVRGAYKMRTYSFHTKQSGGWYMENEPRTLVDAGLAQLEDWRPMLCRKGEGWFELAWQMDGGMMPLSGLFCLACPRKIGTQLCLVWRFHGDGTPVLPNISGE